MHDAAAAFSAKTLGFLFSLIHGNWLSLKYKIFAAPSLNPNLPLSPRDAVDFGYILLSDAKSNYPLKCKGGLNSKQLLSK